MGPSGPIDIKEKLKRLEDAYNYDGPHKWVPFLDYLKTEEVRNGSRQAFMTEWPEFDFYTGGIVTQELTIVSGVQGNGKSLFCRSLAHQLLKKDVPVGYIHFEGSFLDAFKPFDYKPDFRLFVPNQKEAGNPAWIIEQCYRFKSKYDGKVIFLDHLHYIMDMNMKDNISLNIGALLRNLITEVCEGLDMAVFLVAHQQMTDAKTEPGIETIRDSSFLRQEPANVIIVHRLADPGINKEAEKTYEMGYAMVKIDKSRRLGTYKKKVTFKKTGDWLMEGL